MPRASASSTRVKTIVLTLRQRILNWSYPPRHQLTEESLCTEFGVSRSPIRQALTQLATEGLLEREPHQSFRVRQLLLSDVSDLYEFRFAIEAQAVRGLVRNGFPKDAEMKLRMLWNDPAGLADEDGRTLVERDEAFHTGLVEAHGNRLMVEQIRRVNERLYAFREFDFFHNTRYESTSREHTILLDRIAARDEQGAVEALRVNITAGLDNVEQTIAHLIARSYSCLENEETPHVRRAL